MNEGGEASTILTVFKIVCENPPPATFCEREACEHLGRSGGKKKVIVQRLVVKTPQSSLFLFPPGYSGFGRKRVCICIFHFSLTRFSNLSYLASSFLRTYCPHVLMLFKAL